MVIEGAEDLVDYQVLDGSERRLAVRQAKTRQEPGVWGAPELARILCRWGQLDNAADAEFTFVTDASVNDSGRQLLELIEAMRVQPDAAVLQETAARLGRGGVRLPSLEVLRRVRILTRMGSTEQILAQLEVRVLLVLQRARAAVLADAEAAVNRLYRRLFVVGGKVDHQQRTITRADVLAALGVDESSLVGGLAWSDAVAESYRAAVVEFSQQARGFVLLDVISVTSVPQVMRLLDAPDRRSGHAQSLDVILDERQAVLVGATGQGKTTALFHLASVAASRGLVPVVVLAAGYTSGSLHSRVRHAVETRLGQRLTVGAAETVMALPTLVLLIDGVSEVDVTVRDAVHEDLQRLTTQRPVRVVMTGRDLSTTMTVASLPDPPAAYRLTGLDSATRRQLACAQIGYRDDVVELIESRLGDAADNPMLFLMALSVSSHGVPDSRAEVYQQFLRGLAVRARVADSGIHLAAMGSAWAQLIGRGLRATDHYTWLSALSGALNDLDRHPVWRGQACSPDAALSHAQTLGLLGRLDPDSGLAPLHDSFADYLAARAIVRGEAPLPDVLSTRYDEALLFVVDMDGLSDEAVYRLAVDNPLLACRVSRLPFARGPADPQVVGRLLGALTAGCELPLISQAPGLRLYRHPRFTGVVLAAGGCEMIDDAQFARLTHDHAAVMVPADMGSLPLAIKLWALAVHRAHQPPVRVFQLAPRADPELATHLLPEYQFAVAAERHRLITTTLPPTVREQVTAAIGPPGIVAFIDDPEPGRFGGLDLPVHYRPDTQYRVQRSGAGRPDEDERLATTTLTHLMERHPTHQAAHEIHDALTELTHHTWPKS